MTLRLVADDLTGALNSAVQFCRPARGVLVVPRPTQVPEVGADRPAALNLASRDGTRDAARAAASRSAPFLAAGGPAFKKIDSLLRGHWAAEIAATLPLGFASCVLAPAFPAQGRITREGRQFAASDTGALDQVGLPLSEHLAAEGLAVAGDAHPADSRLPPVHVFDAVTQDDLASAVAACSSLPGPVLWCGSAGLALALAGEEPPSVDRGSLHRDVLVVIGTDHPVTRLQLSTILDHGGIAHIPLGAAAERDEKAIRAALRSGAAIVTADIPATADRATAARLIADRLAAVLPRLDPPGTLVVAGGETLLSVCDGLGVASLDVVGQYAPGIPLSVMSGGPWAGTRVLSKSGAFGGARLLLSMLHRMTKSDAGEA